jgi:hypothetical protein
VSGLNPITDAERAELANVFTYHAPTESQVSKYRQLRDQAHEFALIITESVPACEERKQALFALRAAVMWANAGIACHG